MKKNKSNNKSNNISNNKSNSNTSSQSDGVYLNGPLNYIKLINNNTTQSVWLFMDFHKDIIHQQKCEDYEAKDFYKYLYKKLSESDELIDFF